MQGRLIAPKTAATIIKLTIGSVGTVYTDTEVRAIYEAKLKEAEKQVAEVKARKKKSKKHGGKEVDEAPDPEEKEVEPVKEEDEATKEDDEDKPVKEAKEAADDEESKDAKEQALAESMRIMVEEHFYWILAVDRYSTIFGLS